MSDKRIKYKCSFQEDWLSIDDFKPWLRKVEGDKHSAKCSVCFKTISIAGQGVKALESHAKSSKHNEKLPKSTSSIIKFTSKKAETSNAEPVTEDTSKSKKQSTITDFGVKTHTQNAEIFWALDVVLSGYSFNSCQNKNDLFCNMFPDSNIAKNFACGKTKCSYIVTYGLAPYFKSLLNDTLSSLDCFVAMFDESYHKILRRGQMDLHVRF